MIVNEKLLAQMIEDLRNPGPFDHDPVPPLTRRQWFSYRMFGLRWRARSWLHDRLFGPCDWD